MHPISLFETKRESYARAFLNSFIDEFNTAQSENTNSFHITRKQLDEFIIENGFSEIEEVPEKDDESWAKFVNIRNSVRRELNEASSIGVHGHPPYRVDYEKGVYLVRLLSNMVTVTAQQMAESILSLAKTKQKKLDRMHNYLREHMEYLPPALQARVGMQDKAFHRAVMNATAVLNGYVEDMSETYEDAQAFIALPKEVSQ